MTEARPSLEVDADADADAGEEAEELSPSSGRERTEIPPEIKALKPAELADLMAKGRVYVIKKTKSRQIADQVMSDTFYKLTTTRRWDPAKGPLEPWFLLAVKSELSHHWKRQATVADAEAGFQREAIPDHVPSIEAREVERQDEADVDEETAAQLAELRAALGDHPLTPRVLDCLMREMTPKQIAESLGVPERDVYGAIKLIKHHAKRIRERRAQGKEEP